MEGDGPAVVRWTVGGLVLGGLICGGLWRSASVPMPRPRSAPAPTESSGAPARPSAAPVRTVAPSPPETAAPDPPAWMPAELDVSVVTDAGEVVPHALVVGDCGVRGRAGSDGRWVGLVAAGPCELEAVREDGLLTVRSSAVPVELSVGRSHTLTLSLPDAVQGGLGVAVGAHRCGVVIRAVRPESPAAAAGLEVGDCIRTVDGVETTGWDAQRFAAAGIGAVGTWVQLELRTSDTGGLSLVRVERAWLPPGRVGADQATVEVPLASLSDATRRELAAIRRSLLDLAPDGELDLSDPEVRALVARARALAAPDDPGAHQAPGIPR